MSTQAPTSKRPPRRGGGSARLELGLAAFAPAFALMALRLAWDAPWLALAWASAAVLGAAATIPIVFIVRRGNAEAFAFDDIEDAGPEVVGHVTTYIIPLVIDPTQSGAQVVVATLALMLIVWIHVATGRVLVSPLLYVFGRRAYAATTRSGPSYFLVAKSDPALWVGSTRCRAVGSAILVEARSSGADHR